MPNQDLTVTHANTLVNANYNLNLFEIRLIVLAGSMVDPRKKSCGELFISCAEYEKTFGLEKGNATYQLLRDAAKSLIRNPIKLFDSKTQKVKELVWLVSNEYEIGDKGAGVTIEFSPKIEPYIFQLNEYFTTLNFEHVAKLNTPFSFRLYQWLYEVRNLDKHKVNNTIELVLSVKEMKEKAQLKGAYGVWADFAKFALKPAIEKINANTDLSVVWRPVKTGRKVTAVQFNYVIEKASQAKPLRPRLYRRPKVKVGSHAEGEWMRKNEALLTDYENALKQYDPSLKLDLADVRRLIDIYKARGECLEIHEHYQLRVKELKERTNKK